MPGVNARRRMLFRRPSFVSPTTALIEPTVSLPGRASVQSRMASAARGTASVLVSTMGVSISPSSMIWVLPINLPYPLPTTTPAGTFS